MHLGTADMPQIKATKLSTDAFEKGSDNDLKDIVSNSILTTGSPPRQLEKPDNHDPDLCL